MSIPITWVDAFSDVPFGGNPAGVCVLPADPDDPDRLSDARMQSVAFELGIAETAFLTPTEDPAVFGLRWFSPTVEIDLCGHATLAAAHALRQAGRVDRRDDAHLPHPQWAAACVLRRRPGRTGLPGRPAGVVAPA